MKKYVLDLQVSAVEHPNSKYTLIKLTDKEPLPQMLPGQFVEVRVDGSPTTFLRRPISINYVDRERNEMWLLVAAIGDGTRALARLKTGDTLNCVLPLGNSFTMPASQTDKVLLVGGGVGVAPLLFFGQRLKDSGITPTFLLGVRSAADLLEYDMFSQTGRVLVTTEDGSFGEKGFVTQHSLLNEPFDSLYVCGPKPMMVAVARYAHEHNLFCEVSLENTMACGIGACLCCVEKLKDEHHVCVCTEGPVFNIEKLSWLN